MKKIFLFAAAIVAAMTINADVYDFTLVAAQTDYQITNASLNETESSETKFVYDVEADSELNFVANVAPDFTFKYKNSSAKEKAFIVNAANSIEFGGKNGRIEIANLLAGDKLVLTVAAKGSKDAILSVVDKAGEDGQVIGGATITLPKKEAGAEGADEQGYIYKEWTIDVTGDMIIEGILLIKETNAGFRIKAASLNGEEQAIDNVSNGTKAEKVFENGQLVIIKNGVKFNALGAQL